MKLLDIICILKTTIRYYLRGKLVPSWDLKMHITRNLLHKSGLDTITTHTDDDLDSINFDEIYENNRKADSTQTKFPTEYGVYDEIEIPVDKVDIDTSWFKGIGLAEDMFYNLIDLDKVTESRVITANIITSWGAAKRHGFDETSEKSDILKLGPLSDAEPIILHFHGGGGIVGNSRMYREFIGRVSTDTRVRCISVDYRKAPKYPFPTQIYDALISFLYLVEKGFKPGEIILMGDSFGGNLVLALLFVLRRLGMHKVRGVIAISPGSDRTIPKYPSLEENKCYDFMHYLPLEDPLAMQRLVYKPGVRYSPEYHEELKYPLISTTYGDFSDFPSTFIQAGEKELTRDQIYDLYERVKAANPEGTVIYDQVEGGLHVPQLLTHSLPAKWSFEGVKKYVESII